ncbi:hypothetical protein [Mocis latipes granulovirus]|uniref:Uncharacterized protein n=1 Tax=Mocis latipes granulovirus TaxID=2072024 RepID=A0A161CD55_9BBAC|nr:hypothetical protein [Mocis latipes granulovirus]AKR17471.1 hypothetical protein [Mocis latipes granulovirus]
MSCSVPIERLQKVHVKVGGEKKALQQTKLLVTDRNLIEATFLSHDGYVDYIELSGFKGNDYTATATVLSNNDSGWSEYNVAVVGGKITFRLKTYLHSCSVVVNGAQQFTIIIYLV